MAQVNNCEFVGVKEVEAHVKNHGVAGLEQFFKKKLEGWKEVEINMAITGVSGSGKSSFINAIRGLDDDDPNAAEVGVTECTTEPTCYPLPNNDNIKLWDLPGIGTPKHPTLKAYCKEINLKFYDIFLIFTNTRFGEYDLKLAKKIRYVNKRFFFIRTKIDQDVSNEKRKKSFNEDVLLSKIRDDCRQNLGDFVLTSRGIFLISNHDLEKWDFDGLMKAILDILPIHLREAFTLSLTRLSSDMLKRKVQILKGRVEMVALRSDAAAPHPDLDINIDVDLITREISFYRSQLGLPEEEGSAEFFKVSFAIESTAEESKQCNAFVEPAVTNSLSFRNTYNSLQHCLTAMEKTAFSVLNDITAESTGNQHLE